ncbi:hypothetical protein ACFVGM_08930 [Kitasatospora purpeofusca]
MAWKRISFDQSCWMAGVSIDDWVGLYAVGSDERSGVPVIPDGVTAMDGS